MSRTALIAGAGALPRLLAEGLGPDFLLAELEGQPSEVPCEALRFRFERLVPVSRSIWLGRGGGIAW